MADRSLLVRAGWVLVIVTAGSVTACKERTPAPPPSTTPAAATLAPERAPAPVASAPSASEAPASAVSPAAPVTPSATATPPVAASASASPTADPAEAQRKQQEERIRAELAAAKARADSLSSAANTECPDLKPGELRHPGAVAHCARLRSEATQAVSQYEALKQQVAAAGIKVQ
jgi:hypothetical protein